MGNDGWDPTGSPFVSSAISQLERVARLPGSRTTADQALIILAAQRDEPTPRAAWQRLLEKAQRQALNAADYDALYNLVQQRYRGMAIDDEELWQLHGVLCQRDDIPAQIHVRYGYYADRSLQDARRSTSAFRRALQILEFEQNAQPLRRAVKEAGIELTGQVEACEY